MSNDEGSGHNAADRTTRLASLGSRPPVRIRECELVAVEGPDKGKKFLLQGALVRVGKGDDNDVVLADTAVSRQHLVIEDREDGYVLRDLGSTNGTFINGARTKEAYLAPGVNVIIGATTLRFQPRQTELFVSPSDEHSFAGLIGHSLSMRELFGYLERVAVTNLSVVLLGETGTGKEMVARAIHEASPRRDHPFVVFDCAATDANLVGDALFGHKAAAFTGAEGSRKGTFLTAHTGTLFIDEIGDLPLDIQPKLLRALERREIQPIGSDQSIRVDVRVICATHRHLETMVAEGRFRQDLFYRLSGLTLDLPPLRNRPDDLVPLAEYFLQAFPERYSLSPEAMAALQAYSWPGNVRELKNVIDRAVALTRGTVIDASQLMLGKSRPAGPEPAAPAAVKVAPRSLEQMERDTIQAALTATGWNKSEAAKILGITRQTLREKIDRYGIRQE